MLMSPFLTSRNFLNPLFSVLKYSRVSNNRGGWNMTLKLIIGGGWNNRGGWKVISKNIQMIHYHTLLLVLVVKFAYLYHKRWVKQEIKQRKLLFILNPIYNDLTKPKKLIIGGDGIRIGGVGQIPEN